MCGDQIATNEGGTPCGVEPHMREGLKISKELLAHLAQIRPVNWHTDGHALPKHVDLTFLFYRQVILVRLVSKESKRCVFILA